MRVAPPTRVADAPLERRNRSRLLLVAIMWAIAVGATLAVASETAVGPVIVKISEGHGIHLGDVIFACAAAISAATGTWLSRQN